MEGYRENLWLQADQSTYFIRNQSRKGRQRQDLSEDDIELHTLTNKFPYYVLDKTIPVNWFHATSWKSAEKKINKGPNKTRGPSDFARYGAFFLNPNYDDCYDWLYDNNEKFQGEHAILIYRFYPWVISSNGEELNLKQWRQLVQQRSTSDIRCPYDWSFTFQNSDPKNISTSNSKVEVHHMRFQNSDCEHIETTSLKVKARRMKNGEYAKQLVIHSEKMCKEIHRCLIGCIYFENQHHRENNNSNLGNSMQTSGGRGRSKKIIYKRDDFLKKQL